MVPWNSSSRRAFLAAVTAAPVALTAKKSHHVPIGLELYSVDKDLQQDFTGTMRAVAAMGYDCVEFIPSHFDWTVSRAKEVRSLLDDLGLRCYSTRSWERSFTPENLPRAIELDQILGNKFMMLTTKNAVANLDGWKAIAETLNRAAEKMRPLGMRTGYHNHPAEFVPVGGRCPIEVLADNTSKDVKFEFDAGNCVSVGSDPVAWIEKNPGRFATLHVKDWSPDAGQGFRVLLGEGTVPWPRIFQAVEKSGGVEFYLIEQEGSRYPSIETARRSLALYRKLYV
jgi:sugar phosphate isomerase/epimerase